MMTVIALSTIFCGVERELADRNMNQRRLVRAELDLTSLDLADRAQPHPWSPCPSSGSASGRAGPSTLPRRPTERIMSGRSDQGVEAGPVFLLDPLDQLFAAEELGAGRFGFA